MRRKPFVHACTFLLLTATVFNSAHGAGHFNNGKLSRDERLLPRPYQVSFGNNADIYTLGAVGLTISPDSFGKTQDSKLQNNFVVATVERFKRSLHLLNSTAQYRRTKYSPLRKENEEGFRESVKSTKDNSIIKFFNMGKKNKWEKLLDQKIENKIRKEFFEEMKELNYL